MSRPTNPSRTRSAGQVVEVKAVTWNKDSHGLFDYENSYYDMKKFQISHSTLLFRQNNEIQSRPKNGMEIENEENLEFLLSISKRETGADKFLVDIVGSDGVVARNSRASFLIVRSLKCRDGRSQRGYPCSPGT